MPSGVSITITALKRERIWGFIFKSLILCAVILIKVGHLVFAQEDQDGNSQCERMGWFPNNFGLKDHSVFFFDGHYYIVSNILPGENKFAYARSEDLCTWEELDPVLPRRISGTWDEMAIWAPLVFVENGTYYMYFTGVTRDFTQSIMLATSDNPANPESWQSVGMIFQPNHPGMNWQAGHWADCRDPIVIKIGNLYYLYYTGRDGEFGIIGLATANSHLGPWKDWGAVLRLPTRYAMPESSMVVKYGNFFYLFYNDTSQGERFRIGVGPGGPWTEGYIFKPGWAHEVWQSQEGRWHTSYLTDYSISISPLIWDAYFDPPRPIIGSAVYHLAIPLVIQQ